MSNRNKHELYNFNRQRFGLWDHRIPPQRKAEAVSGNFQRDFVHHMNKDRQLLIDLKNEVLLILKARGQLRPFVLLKNKRPSQNNCDGWVIQIAQVRGYNCFAELWLDHFTSHRSRKLLYCLRSKGKSERFAELTKKASKKFGTPYKITIDDTQHQKHFTLTKALSASRFGKAIYEEYKDEERFYGIYEINSTTSSKIRKESLVNRAVNFFLDIVEVLRDQEYFNTLDYPSIENRLVVRKHLTRERRSHLAELRKAQDKYICHICDFNYSRIYGSLGRGFAESHHLVPLSSSNKIRETSLEDLITVCANCHRMLHKMPGKKDDVSRLKSIMKSSRKNFR